MAVKWVNRNHGFRAHGHFMGAAITEPHRTKPIEDVLAQQDEADRPNGLRKRLRARDLIGFGVGIVIGTGIFTLTGVEAREHAGPAVVLSFVLAGVVSLLAALCYAELASMVPVSGSAYTYSYATLGELVAWIIGWDLIIEYGVGNTSVAISWANYFRSLLADLGIDFPAWLASDFRTAGRLLATDPVAYARQFGGAPSLFGQPVIVNVLAFGITALITALPIPPPPISGSTNKPSSSLPTTAAKPAISPANSATITWPLAICAGGRWIASGSASSWSR